MLVPLKMAGNPENGVRPSGFGVTTAGMLSGGPLPGISQAESRRPVPARPATISLVELRMGG